jgi:hypothetical protein
MFDLFWNLIPYTVLFLICAFITRLIFRINTLVEYQQKQCDILERIYERLGDNVNSEISINPVKSESKKTYGEIKIDPNKNYFQ